MIPLIGGIQNQTDRERKQSSGYQGPGGDGIGELSFNGYRFSVQDDEKALETDSGDGDTTM